MVWYCFAYIFSLAGLIHYTTQSAEVLLAPLGSGSLCGCGLSLGTLGVGLPSSGSLALAQYLGSLWLAPLGLDIDLLLSTLSLALRSLPFSCSCCCWASSWLGAT